MPPSRCRGRARSRSCADAVPPRADDHLTRSPARGRQILGSGTRPSSAAVEDRLAPERTSTTSGDRTLEVRHGRRGPLATRIPHQRRMDGVRQSRSTACLATPRRRPADLGRTIARASRGPRGRWRPSEEVDDADAAKTSTVRSSAPSPAWTTPKAVDSDTLRRRSNGSRRPALEAMNVASSPQPGRRRRRQGQEARRAEREVGARRRSCRCVTEAPARRVVVAAAPVARRDALDVKRRGRNDRRAGQAASVAIAPTTRPRLAHELELGGLRRGVRNGVDRRRPRARRRLADSVTRGPPPADRSHRERVGSSCAAATRVAKEHSEVQLADRLMPAIRPAAKSLQLAL